MTTLPVRPEWLELGQRLRDARRARNMTQARVAALLKLSRPTVAYVELGRQNPMLHIQAFAALYTMPIRELIDPAETTGSGLTRRLLSPDEDVLLRAYRRRDLATIHRLIEAWWTEAQP